MGRTTRRIEPVNLGEGSEPRPREPVRPSRRPEASNGANHALGETSHILQALVEASPLGIAVHDLEGRVTLWNPAAERIFGWRAEEVLGKRLPTVPAGRWREVRSVVDRALRREIVTNQERVRRRKDGTLITVQVSTAPIRDEGDNVTAIMAIYNDITELKRAQERDVRVARLYRVLTRVNEAIARIHDERSLLQEMCRAIVEDGCLQGAWIDLIDRSSGGLDRVARHGAVPKEPGDGRYRQDSDSREREALFALWGGTQALGVLGILVPREYLFEAEEVGLIEELGARISFAIESVEEERLRKQAEDTLARSLDRLQRAMAGTIDAMAMTTEIRDPYTAGHQRRVSRLAQSIAEEMGLPAEEIEGIRMAANIHDLGKISVPAEILSKPGRLSEFEFNLIKTHPQAGREILRGIDFPWPIAEVVGQHHERMDGSGYPAGLAGPEIRREARVLMVADVVEAMASHRPYRPALGLDRALEEIGRNQGLLYDAEVVQACLRVCAREGFSLE